MRIAISALLLYESHVSFTGEYYQVSDVSITPRPLQSPIPTYLATTTPHAIRFAVRNNFGVLGAPPYALARIVEIIETYRAAASPDVDPRLTLARFFTPRARERKLWRSRRPSSIASPSASAASSARRQVSRCRKSCDRISIFPISYGCTKLANLYET
jgi:alkanesulfonate monooxygenase SsuD/methylene tetrahydromethanopterin reductase-like flavin-dependent oxidoreductase (luciferase family)